MSVNKANQYKQLRAGPSEFSKATTKRRQICFSTSCPVEKIFHKQIPKIYRNCPLTGNFLTRKLSEKDYILCDSNFWENRRFTDIEIASNR